MKQRLGFVLILGIFLSGSLAAGENCDAPTPLDGCEFLTGSGQGHYLIPPTPETAGTDQGTIEVVSQVTGRSYTLAFKGVGFPLASPGGEPEHTVYVTWRILENGVRGVNRLRATSYPDPEDPTKVLFIGEAQVLDGNRYKTGGAYMVGELDLTTGSYTLENYNLVLCRGLGGPGKD